ncbi:MAG: hypothetical protein EA369_02125, partial [Bradymonadales bacterium]
MRLYLLVAMAFMSFSCTNPQTGVRVEMAEEGLKPGLHSLMHEMAVRHAKIWFAGQAENWELADYEVHELEELVELIQAAHPEYDGMPIADLLRSMLVNSIEAGVRSGNWSRSHLAFELGS